MDYLPVIAQFGWPVIILLCGLFFVNRITGNVRPIFVSIVGGVAKNAASNASAYAIAIMFGLSASLSAFVDVFKDMDHTLMQIITWPQCLALFARVANPFIVAVLAYATQNKFVLKTGSTNPPFPPTTPIT